MRRKWLICCVIVCIWGHFICHSCVLSASAEEDTSLSVEQTILQGLVGCMSEISLWKYGVTIEDVRSMYQNILLSQPQLFYVKQEISYTYGQNGNVHSIYPTYNIVGEDLTNAKHFYDQTIQNFMTEVSTMDKIWSDAEKVIYLHDYLASRYVYSPVGQAYYDAYHLFALGHGVCQSFALAMVALGEAWGLTVDIVISSAMDHAWNHVCVDGSYYHVDVTRDLPTENNPLSHDRIFLSDEGIQALGYHSYTCFYDHACDHHTYETDEQVSVLAPFKGAFYGFPSGLLGYHNQHGITMISVTDQNICQSLPVDLDGNQITTLKDLMLLRHKYPHIPDIYAESLKQHLLNSKEKELHPSM